MSKQSQSQSQPTNNADDTGAVLAKYTTKLWTVFAPRTGPNNIVAYFNGPRPKYHFCHIGPPNDPGGFIQNALSNGATPVIARVSTSRSKIDGAIKYKVTFSDANTGNRIIV